MFWPSSVLLFIAKQDPTLLIYNIFSIYELMDIWAVFHFWLMSNATVNICVQFCVEYAFISFECISRTVVTGNIVTLYLIFYELPYSFPKTVVVCTQYPQQWMKVPTFPYSCQHLLVSTCWIVAILGGKKWYPILVLICFPNN
jgi:hypothetical protein